MVRNTRRWFKVISKSRISVEDPAKMIQKMTETSQWTMTMKMKAVVLKMNMKAISSMMTKKREVKVIKDTTKIITNLQKIRKNQKRKKSIAQSLKMSQLGHRIKRVVMRIRLTKIYMIN